MRKILAFLSLLMAFSVPLLAQNVNIKGNLQDTSEKRSLPNAVVSLLYKKDSTLASFTRTDKNGAFQLNNLVAGKYVLLITYPKFADYADELELKNEHLDLGKIPLTQKSLLLKEVVIRSGQAIRIKGDTTEFNADSFVVKEGATVEDLMKKLPGFQVNSKGEITAQGKRVDKVLVDGEEFFGDDPTMATQNLSAKAVDKVQVFDTKTEQQQLTGITSGTEGKTINIKLKEDKKKGAFGKFIAGTDFNDLVDAKALYNRFVGKKKVALYGTRTGLNTGSLNWEERQKLGIENDAEYDEISGFYYSFGSNDEFSDWSLRGIPTATTGGGLFNNKWNADKQNVNLSYRYNRLETVNQSSSFRQGLLPRLSLENTLSNTSGFNQQHAVNGKYEWKLDSLTSFKFTSSATYKHTKGYENTYRDFTNQDNVMVRKGNQIRSNDNTKLQNDNSLVYKQLFKKKNRQLLTTLRFGITEDDQEGMSDVRTEFDRNVDGTMDSLAVVDQMRVFDGRSQTLGGKISFSEPLTTKINLIVDYGHNRNTATSYRNTYNQNGNGKYDVLDEDFSNNFDMNAYSHSTMAILRYTGKKVRFATGAGMSSVKLKLFNVDSKEKKDFDFLNLTPQASFNYAFKPQTNWSFNYRGTTRQPNIEQLQPVRDNTNPLYIREGNPDLKVGFNHNLSTFFNSYKVLSGRGIFLNANFNKLVNAITNATTLDLATGKITSRPINVNGNYNWSTWMQVNKNGGEKKLGRGITANTNGGRSINFLNGNKNTTDYSRYEIGFSLDYEASEKYSFELRPRIGQDFSTTSSVEGSRKTNFLSYGGNVSGMIMLPGKLELSSNANFDLREGLDAFGPATNIILWNAMLSKKVLKKKDGKIMLVASDLLNQNRGFNRNINSNFITEDRYSRIGQYFLLKFEWSFNKMPGSK